MTRHEGKPALVFELPVTRRKSVPAANWEANFTREQRPRPELLAARNTRPTPLSRSSLESRVLASQVRLVVVLSMTSACTEVGCEIVKMYVSVRSPGAAP